MGGNGKLKKPQKVKKAKKHSVQLGSKPQNKTPAHLKKYLFKKGNKLAKGHGSPAAVKVIRNYTAKEFFQAIKNVEETDGINIFEHFIRRALREDAVLIAMMKKILPDISHLKGEIDIYQGEKIEIIPEDKADAALESRIKGFLSN